MNNTLIFGGEVLTNADLVARLEKLDACAVSDALDSLELPGAQSGLPRRSTRKRIAGIVQTVKLHAQAPEGGSKRHLGTAAIEAAPTHQQMASRLGCSREMVSRLMKDLVQGGYVEVDRMGVRLMGRMPARW